MPEAGSRIANLSAVLRAEKDCRRFRIPVVVNRLVRLARSAWVGLSLEWTASDTSHLTYRVPSKDGSCLALAWTDKGEASAPGQGSQALT